MNAAYTTDQTPLSIFDLAHIRIALIDSAALRIDSLIQIHQEMPSFIRSNLLWHRQNTLDVSSIIKEAFDKNALTLDLLSLTHEAIQLANAAGMATIIVFCEKTGWPNVPQKAFETAFNVFYATSKQLYPLLNPDLEARQAVQRFMAHHRRSISPHRRPDIID